MRHKIKYFCLITFRNTAGHRQRDISSLFGGMGSNPTAATKIYDVGSFQDNF